MRVVLDALLKGQKVSNGAKQGLTGVQRGQMGSILVQWVKQGQTGSNRDKHEVKWGQTGSNKGSNRVKRGQMGSNGAKRG